MILDAIIGLVGSLFALLAEGVALFFVPVVNLIAAGIETVIGLFVAGFSLGRIDRTADEPKAARSRFAAVTTLLIICGAIGCAVVMPKVLNRKVTLVAADGHSLPFAALVIHTSDGDRHEWTDGAGNIVIPRFATEALTVKNPRYVEQRWTTSEIDSQLIVRRTALGAGLDALADRLLKPE